MSNLKDKILKHIKNLTIAHENLDKEVKKSMELSKEGFEKLKKMRPSNTPIQEFDHAVMDAYNGLMILIPILNWMNELQNTFKDLMVSLNLMTTLVNHPHTLKKIKLFNKMLGDVVEGKEVNDEYLEKAREKLKNMKEEGCGKEHKNTVENSMGTEC